MANYQEMYCNHCKRNTTFYLESDLLWYCDECGNVYDSIPIEDIEDEEDWEDTIGDVIRCPFCHNLIEVDELEDGYMCPVCFEELTNQLEELEEDDWDEE